MWTDFIRWTAAPAVLLACLALPRPASAGDEAGLTQTSFISMGALGGARVAEQGGWSGVLGAEVSYLPFTGTKCPPPGSRSQRQTPEGSVVDRPSSAPEECRAARLWLPGLALGGVYAPQHDRGAFWLEGELYNRSRGDLAALSYGAGMGPALTVGDGVDAGVQMTLWAAFVGIIPYVRGGWMLDGGGFGELGLMIKAPLPLL